MSMQLKRARARPLIRPTSKAAKQKVLIILGFLQFVAAYAVCFVPEMAEISVIVTQCVFFAEVWRHMSKME